MIDLDARPEPTPFSERTGLLTVRYMEAINITLFRLSKGKVGGTIFGAPVILLTASGHKTGVRRTKPLLALPDGRSWIVVGSRGGTSKHPDWYENLRAFERQRKAKTVPKRAPFLRAPIVEYAGDRRVEVGSEVLKGKERAKWWARLVDVYPRFDAYQRRTSRQIPVVRLTPTH